MRFILPFLVVTCLIGCGDGGGAQTASNNDSTNPFLRKQNGFDEPGEQGGGTNQEAGDLVGFWEFSGATMKEEDGSERTSYVDGDIEFKADGTASGQRSIGGIITPMEGSYSVNGNALTIDEESYTYAIIEGEYDGQPVYILTLNVEGNDGVVFRLMRRR